MNSKQPASDHLTGWRVDERRDGGECVGGHQDLGLGGRHASMNSNPR